MNWIEYEWTFSDRIMLYSYCSFTIYNKYNEKSSIVTHVGGFKKSDAKQQQQQNGKQRWSSI